MPNFPDTDDATRSRSDVTRSSSPGRCVSHSLTHTPLPLGLSLTHPSPDQPHQPRLRHHQRERQPSQKVRRVVSLDTGGLAASAILIYLLACACSGYHSLSPRSLTPLPHPSFPSLHVPAVATAASPRAPPPRPSPPRPSLTARTCPRGTRTTHRRCPLAFLSFCQSVFLPSCLPAFLPSYLPTCLPAYLPTCLDAWMPIEWLVKGSPLTSTRILQG